MRRSNQLDNRFAHLTDERKVPGAEMARLGTRPKAAKTWKRVTIAGCYGVAGCAFAVALVSGCFLRREPMAKRPEPWNTTAITAKFDEIDTRGEDNHLVFEYTLENNTDRDYPLENTVAVCLAVKLASERGLSPCHDNVKEAIQLPIIVRARQAVMIAVDIPKKYTSPLTPAKSSDGREDQHKKLGEFVAAEMPNLGGFVLFDGENRYEIDLPRGW